MGKLNHKKEFVEELTPILMKYWTLNPDREDGKSECQTTPEDRFESESDDLYSGMGDEYWYKPKELWEDGTTLVLDLDGFTNEFPSTKYDIGGKGHSIIIKPENKKKAIDEMVKQYQKDLEDNFEEEDDENEE